MNCRRDPDTKIWRLSMHAKNSFGAAADSIQSVLEDSLQLEEAFIALPTLLRFQGEHMRR